MVIPVFGFRLVSSGMVAVLNIRRWMLDAQILGIVNVGR